MQIKARKKTGKYRNAVERKQEKERKRERKIPRDAAFPSLAAILEAKRAL